MANIAPRVVPQSERPFTGQAFKDAVAALVKYQKPQTTRTFAETTFTKAMSVKPHYNIYGDVTGKQWASKRIQNEAAALELILKNTTIPVPKVLETGESEDGPYITVQHVDGIDLADIGEQCRRLPSSGGLLDGHRNKNCIAYQTMANENATTFIQETLLPQLAALKSSVSGLNGVIIPPPWVTEHDRREAWFQRSVMSGHLFSVIAT